MEVTRRAASVARVLAGLAVLGLLVWLAVLLPEARVLYVGAVAVGGLVGAAGLLWRDWRVTLAGAGCLGLLGGWGTVGLVGLPTAVLLGLAGGLEHEVSGRRAWFG